MAAAIAARFGGTGLMVAETLAAGLAHGRQLWFGAPANVGRLVDRTAGELGVMLEGGDVANLVSFKSG